MSDRITEAENSTETGGFANAMLAVRSLSVGNYLKKNGIVVQIDGRSIFDMWDDNGVIKLGYEPIELTEKWLLNFGFKKFSTGSFCKDLNKYGDFYLAIDIKHKNGVWLNILNGNEESTVKLGHIKNVHELQNLFRSITGNELVGNDR